jgi:tetratricopeptide (TPR) repeat protein
MEIERISSRGYLHAAWLLAACVVFAYGNSLHNSFQYDDYHSLVQNPHVRQLVNIPQFFVDPQMFSRNMGSEMYRPLVLVSYAFNHALGAYQVEGYRLVNMGLHLGAASFFFAILLVLGVPEKAALAGALLFVVHPLAGEPVNYISSRSESMGSLFLLASFYFYACARRTIVPFSLLCFGAALLSKEIAVSLLGLLLAYDSGWRGLRLRCFWRRHMPYWIVAALYLWGISALVREAVLDAPVRPWTAQLSTQAKALVYYVKLLMFPQPLSVEHQFFTSTSWGEVPVVAAVAILLSVLWLAWRMFRRENRQALFWLGWPVIILVPTLIVPLNVLVNERRLYLALAGFIGLLLWICRKVKWTPTVRVAAGLTFFFFLLLTVQRNQTWATEESLWEDAKLRAPLMARPHLRLGILRRQAGLSEQAETSYRRALELDPANAPAYNNLGNLYTSMGKYVEAEQAYKKALGILPSYPEALSNLATLYGNYLKRFEDALELYRRALAVSGKREEIYNNIGIIYLNLSDFAAAEAVLRQAQVLDPSSAKIYYNLGGALEGQGKRQEAVQVFERTVQLNPRHVKAHYKLGLLHQQAGREGGAVEAFDKVLRWADNEPLRKDAHRRLLQLQGGTP